MLGLEYILKLEEISPLKLSNKIGVSSSLVYRWIHGMKPIPKQRTIQIHSKVFPDYPEVYIDKEITEADKIVLNKIRRSRTETTDYKSKKIVELRNNYDDEVRETLTNIAGALRLNTDFLQQNPHMNANMYLLMLSTMLSEQTIVLNDFKALCSLEADKGQRSANALVSVVLSALCTALGRGGYLDDIICAEPLRVVLSDDGAKVGTLDRKTHEHLINVFTNIIDSYDKRDKIIETLNERLKSKNNED